MPNHIYLLIFFLLTQCHLSYTSQQDLKFDDIISLREKFSSIIRKIKEYVNQNHCPNEWHKLGGSCYYLSNITLKNTLTNNICHLYSNRSNFMKIRNTIELFYVVYLSRKYNLSSLIIGMNLNHFNVLNVTKIVQNQWKLMKEKYRENRIEYNRLREEIFNILNSSDLRLIKHTENLNLSIQITKTNTTSSFIDNYNEIDSFDQLDNIQDLCSQINWNIINNNTNIYTLEISQLMDKIICSISNIQPKLEYKYICEYVLDFCFGNLICGKHGRCVNMISNFKCSCKVFYEGDRCEKISRRVLQTFSSFILIIILYLLSIKSIQSFILHPKNFFINHCQRSLESREDDQNIELDIQQPLTTVDEIMQCDNRADSPAHESSTTTIREMFRTPMPYTFDTNHLYLVGILTAFILLIIISKTTIILSTPFEKVVKLNSSVNKTNRLITPCKYISDYRVGNLIFSPIALCLVFGFSWLIKLEREHLHISEKNFCLIIPIEPFRSENRFTTAAIFGILALEVLKIFEELFFRIGKPLNSGVLLELLERILIVCVIGLRYYPILASLQIKHITARFIACLYMTSDVIFTIIREGSCSGFLPWSQYNTPLDETKVRIESGKWFIIYGIVKNAPHFFLLSYITAELWIRFFYDSIYKLLKQKKNICSLNISKHDDSKLEKYYVAKLLRPNLHKRRTEINENVFSGTPLDSSHSNSNSEDDTELSSSDYFDLKFFWNNYFRFTTLAICIYTVAYLFLYYLTCTFIFFYILQTKYHATFFQLYIGTKSRFTIKIQIIISAVVTLILFSLQLLNGIVFYRKHTIQLYRGLYEEIPGPRNFDSNLNLNSINSIHYSGFLIGYMAWGFTICFHLILFILNIIHITSFDFFIDILFEYILPLLFIYIIPTLITSLIGQYIFSHKKGSTGNIKYRKSHAILLYFYFFADCFLGIISCVIRFLTATYYNIIYMVRLDYSFLGRQLETYDMGFATYVTYLHVEAIYANPIKLGTTFCSLIYDGILQQRRKESLNTDMIRKERIKFRWFLAYTLIRNRRLLQLRKQMLRRLHDLYRTTPCSEDNYKPQSAEKFFQARLGLLDVVADSNLPSTSKSINQLGTSVIENNEPQESTQSHAYKLEDVYMATRLAYFSSVTIVPHAEMSYAQQMQAWRENEIRRSIKRRNHSYIYGLSSQQQQDSPILSNISTQEPGVSSDHELNIINENQGQNNA